MVESQGTHKAEKETNHRWIDGKEGSANSLGPEDDDRGEMEQEWKRCDEECGQGQPMAKAS